MFVRAVGSLALVASVCAYTRINGFLKAVLSRAAGLAMLLNENVHRSINLIVSLRLPLHGARGTRLWKRFCVGGKVSETFSHLRSVSIGIFNCTQSIRVKCFREEEKQEKLRIFKI